MVTKTQESVLTPLQRGWFTDVIFEFRAKFVNAKGKKHCPAESFVFYRTERNSLCYGFAEVIEAGRDNRPVILWYFEHQQAEAKNMMIGEAGEILFQEWIASGRVVEKKIDGINTTDCLWVFAE